MERFGVGGTAGCWVTLTFGFSSGVREGFAYVPQPNLLAWHTLIDGLELVRSEGFSPLQLGVIALKCLLQTKPYFSCVSPLQC
ncbi:hypothetical protein [Coleofasciculus sp. E2-BRE-01]|uniref:hypothetical protein n=1 Tax=Coleofasciculus sp. E2-BRE-01 TaxID=3069524 RepID=UPI0032FC5B01